MVRQTAKVDQMGLSELVQLRDVVNRALFKKIGEERQTLSARLAEIETLWDGAGETIRSGDEASKGAKPARSSSRHALAGKKVVPKYRGPNGEAWAGRGLTPRWLAELESKGESREQYLIKA